MIEDNTTQQTAQPEERPTIASGLSITADATDDLLSDEETDDEWALRGPARGIRLAPPIAAVVAVTLVAAGFWGGAVAEKNHGSSSSGAASSFAGRFRSGQTGRGTTGARGATGARSFAGGGFAGGGFGSGGAGSSAAAGTVSVVNGNTLYILTSAGALVKVTLGPSTTITRTANTTPVGLRPGDNVTVQGSTGKSGDVAATSISATAP